MLVEVVNELIILSKCQCLQRLHRMTANGSVFAMAGASEFRPPMPMPIEKLMYKIYLTAK